MNYFSIKKTICLAWQKRYCAKSLIAFFIVFTIALILLGGFLEGFSKYSAELRIPSAASHAQVHSNTKNKSTSEVITPKYSKSYRNATLIMIRIIAMIATFYIGITFMRAYWQDTVNTTDLVQTFKKTKYLFTPLILVIAIPFISFSLIILFAYIIFILSVSTLYCAYIQAPNVINTSTAWKQSFKQVYSRNGITLFKIITIELISGIISFIAVFGYAFTALSHNLIFNILYATIWSLIAFGFIIPFLFMLKPMMYGQLVQNYLDAREGSTD